MKKPAFILFLSVVLLLSLSACGREEKTPAPEADGVLSSFTAEDLSGGVVDQTVFEGCRVTMVNVWGTFCGPCIREMPDLGTLSRTYADQGFQIIGIPVDVVDRDLQIVPGMAAQAREIIEATGADYRHVAPSASLNEAILDGMQFVPTTIFVDKWGCQLGEVYVGSKSASEWETIIRALLEETP